MKITEMLRQEFILGELEGKGKKEALTELSGVFKTPGINLDSGEMLKVLLEREKLGSTGIGEGIAIPHGKMAGLKEMVISFGRSRKGVDFETLDGRPAHLFFLLMAPENSSGLHLKVLAKISKMLKDNAFRKNLMEAESRDDLFRIISDKDDEI
jgi:PTS system nitrogen regulatory IIA component